MTTTTRRPHGVTATTPKAKGWVKEERARLQTLSDTELVEVCLNGGRELGWCELVSRYEVKLQRFASTITGSMETARDTVQTSFLKLERSLHHYNPEKSFSAWIHTIVGNVAKNFLTRNRPVVNFTDLGESAVWSLIPQSVSPEEILEIKEEKERLKLLAKQALKSLPLQQRTALILQSKGKSYEEIAEIAGIPVGTAKTRIFRGRENMAKYLGVDRVRDETKRAREKRYRTMRANLAPATTYATFRGIRG